MPQSTSTLPSGYDGASTSSPKTAGKPSTTNYNADESHHRDLEPKLPREGTKKQQTTPEYNADESHHRDLEPAASRKPKGSQADSKYDVVDELLLHDLEPDERDVDRVYRKLDLRIIPAFWLLYFICTAIRSNISLALIMNKENGHDLMSVLKMWPKDTSTAFALFYVSYVVFDLPSNLMMSRFGPRAWMARIVIATGIIGACFAAVKHAASLKLLRFLLGMVLAGMWPGMAYYLTLFYPPSRIAKRIGWYFTAGQVSTAVYGLFSAAFQLMDGVNGWVGFQWMFLNFGLAGIVIGLLLLLWLPDRPLPPGQTGKKTGSLRWLPDTSPALKGKDALIHYVDLKRVYHSRPWTLKDVAIVLRDWRLWPLTAMYFGVVGVGVGTQLYSPVLISVLRPNANGITISFLTAPIWIMDLLGALTVTPFSDRFYKHRPLFFVASAFIQIVGLIMAMFARGWASYGGLLVVGFGLGSTVPICMAWTSQIFQQRYGEVGVAVSTALVSGLGNLGSVFTTYALYLGWPEDAQSRPNPFFYSNVTMICILCMSILSAFAMMLLLDIVGNPPNTRLSNVDSVSDFQDGAARRERQDGGYGIMGRKNKA